MAEFILTPIGLIHSPFKDKADTPIQAVRSQARGLFATRHPCRPNPIGLSVVKLLERKENVLKIEGVDVLDGTPLLDIKPYVPDFDHRSAVRAGWYETRSEK